MRIPAAILRHGWRWAAAVSLVIALLVTAGVGRAIWTQQHPTRVATIGVGESVELDGVGYTVTRFDRVGELPPAEPGDDPVTAPEGAQLVIVLIDIDPVGGTDASENYCDFTLTNAAGVTWRPNLELAYGADVPDHWSCASPDEGPEGTPWPVGEPYRAVATFAVPRSMADQLVFEITWAEENRTITVRP